MKKDGILNKNLNTLIASLGHKDTIIICDAGLPIPDESQRVELAFQPGVPGQLEVVSAILDTIVVESAVMAKESQAVSPEMHRQILDLLPADLPVRYVDHKELKEMSRNCKGIIRTGEFTPYSNLLLVCGCAY